MIAFLFIAGSALALVLGVLLGLGLLPFRRTRKTSSFFLLLPSSAAGGEIFGFWLLLKMLNGRVGLQQAIESSFYFGAIVFCALGAVLALAALLPKTHTRAGALLKSTVRGIAGAFVALSCLTVIVAMREEIGLHRMAARMGTGPIGWDPVSYVDATSAWRNMPAMLIVFVIVLVFSARQPRPATI
jgi:hypothetical protein